MKSLTLAPLLIFLAGCSFLPVKKTESVGQKTAESVSTAQSLIVDTVFPALVKAPVQTVTYQVPNSDGQGGTNIVTVTTPANLHVESRTGVQSTDRLAVTERQTVSVPMWVNMVGFGVGLLLIIFAVRVARKNSRALDAGLSAADEGFASAIRIVREHAVNSFDSFQIAKLNGITATLESERGKLRLKKAV